MKQTFINFALAGSLLLNGCQTSPIAEGIPPPESVDIVQKLHTLTAEFMQQADMLERAALRMYYAMKSPTDDIADEDCTFVEDAKNRQLPLLVYGQLRKLRQHKALIGLTESHEEFILYRDARDAMEWAYYQFARTHAYCLL